MKNASNKPAVKQNAGKPAVAAPVLDKKEIAKVAGILTAICVVIAALLAGTNALTKDRIAENMNAEKMQAWGEVVSATDFIALEIDGYDVALGVSGSDIIGCAITTTDKGYGGEMTVMTGFDMEGNITGVKIVDDSETAGLGKNAEKPRFLDQFITISGDWRPSEFSVSKDGGSIDAVTAATISSRAVTRAVNKAIKQYDELSTNGLLVIPVPEIASPTDTAEITEGGAPGEQE